VTKRRTQEERRRETKERLIAATIAHLSERGFENFSMAEIAKIKGLTRGAMQHHYPSREALVADVVSEISRRLQPNMDLTDFLSRNLRDRISLVVDHYWQITGSKTFLAIFEIIVFSRHDPNLLAEVSKTLFEVSRDRDIEWIEMFRDTPASAKRLHHLRTFMLSTLRGLAVRAIAAFDREDREGTLALLKESLYQSMTSTS